MIRSLPVNTVSNLQGALPDLAMPLNLKMSLACHTPQWISVNLRLRCTGTTSGGWIDASDMSDYAHKQTQAGIPPAGGLGYGRKYNIDSTIR